MIQGQACRTLLGQSRSGHAARYATVPLCDEESGGRLNMVSAWRLCTSRGQWSSEMLDDGIPEGRADHLRLAFAIPHPQPIRR